MPVKVDYEAPDLAARIEKLRPDDIDSLPFGVIRLDPEGVVLLYSATEARQSGYRGPTLGKNFFDISRCFGRGDFRTRILRAQDNPPVDIELGLPGDYADPKRELRIRVQSASGGGVWLFIQRDGHG
jgi:photoactive yellow protein